MANVRCRRDFITNVELCLITPVLPIVSTLFTKGHTAAANLPYVLGIAVMQTTVIGGSVFALWKGVSWTLSGYVFLCGVGLGAINGMIAGSEVGPTGFGLSRVSFVQFVLLLPFWHWTFIRDPIILGTAAVMLLANAVFCAWYLIIIPNIVTLHKAWGCYPQKTKLKHFDRGMCGLDAKWNHGMIPPICMQIAGTSAGENNCEPLSRGEFSLHGSMELTVAHYITIACIILYIGASKRQLSILQSLEPDPPRLESNEKSDQPAASRAFF